MSSVISDSVDLLVPNHVAIIMDGNGRWAKSRGKKNSDGHKAGVGPLREVIRGSVEKGVKALTVFAFSSENWQRPDEEVSALMGLFVQSLTDEIDELNAQGVQLRVIGRRERFNDDLLERISYCEKLSGANTGLVLTIAVDFGGRWDISQACQKIAEEVSSGSLLASAIDEDLLATYLSNADLQDPDLCIRTGSEHRISNFLLWQFAYTELFVSDLLWPDFGKEAYFLALEDFSKRKRRFGKVDIA